MSIVLKTTRPRIQGTTPFWANFYQWGDEHHVTVHEDRRRAISAAEWWERVSHFRLISRCKVTMKPRPVPLLPAPPPPPKKSVLL